MSGKMCTVRADNGNDGMLSVTMCVDTMLDLLGSATLIGVGVGLGSSNTSIACFRDMKWPVVPVSGFACMIVGLLL